MLGTHNKVDSIYKPSTISSHITNTGYDPKDYYPYVCTSPIDTPGNLKLYNLFACGYDPNTVNNCLRAFASCHNDLDIPRLDIDSQKMSIILKN